MKPLNFPINFRGKAKYLRGMVFGDLCIDCVHDMVFLNETTVLPETVAQFLGYDKNEDEIYSDDKIRVYDHSRYPLAGTGIENAADFFRFSDIGKAFDNIELFKESAENEN